MLLTETQNVLAEIAASRAEEFGAHFSSQPQTGMPGMVISELEYDPALHEPQHIAHFSLMEMVTGTPHVQLVLPEQPLDVKVITHHEAGRDHPEFARLKLFLGRQLKHAIEEAMPGATDRVHAYHIGDKKDGLDWDVKYIPASAESLQTAKTVADLCMDGLTFVISDFNHLPLQDVGGASYPATIAVKANHMSDLAIPKGRVFRLGGRREVSRDEDSLKMNAKLMAYHQRIEQGLESVGIKVAPVVLSAKDVKTTGFDVSATDATIANAARRVDL